MGEGLTGSAGMSNHEPRVGPTGAGIPVVLLALGVAISNANWSEGVGEGGGETTSLSVVVSISSVAGGGGTVSVAVTERLRGVGEGRLSQSLKTVVWPSPQLAQWCGDEEQQPGVALRLPPPGKVGLGHRWAVLVWLRE